MARPFWSGQLKISLVSFGIQLFPATESKAEIHFHQIDRNTGERVRHQNVSGSRESGSDQTVEKDEIVKGYEYSKGQYVVIEPEEIENLRIPSRKTMEVAQFVSIDEISAMFYEKPYFVVPEDASQAEAFAVVRKALLGSGKAALGKIAFGGREHLLAVAAPDDEGQSGMMAYVLRYAEELRDAADYFREIKAATVDEDQLSLAQDLIRKKSSSFKPEAYVDEYENALRAMVEAKVKHLPLPKAEEEPRSSKVVNLMDALRRSVAGDGRDKKVAAPGKPDAAGKMPADSKKSKKVETISAARKQARKPARANQKPRSA